MRRAFARLIAGFALMMSANAVRAQNLVQNPDFNTGLSPWTQIAGAGSSSAVFVLDNTTGYPTVPSALIADSSQRPGYVSGGQAVSSCMLISSSQTYDLSANVTVGSGATTLVTLYFYSNPVCSGSIISGTGLSSFSIVSGSWAQASTAISPPNGTQSGEVVLSAENLSGEAVHVNFDHVELAAQNSIATTFSLAVPSASNGEPLSFTVTALTQSNGVAAGYSGTVHFTSSDGAATLPTDSGLTNGVATFMATLLTPGMQIITATDVTNASVTGSSPEILITDIIFSDGFDLP